MAGQLIELNGEAVFIDYADAIAYVVVGGREYRWEFHRYCGPTFLRKDGEPVKRPPGENHPVWPAFNAWLKEWEKANPEVRRKGKRKPIKLTFPCLPEKPSSAPIDATGTPSGESLKKT